MSKPLSPEEQRQVRATYGSEVQSMDQIMAQTADFIGSKLGIPLAIIEEEDRLRFTMVEACTWLRFGSPGRALECLEAGLKGRP